MNGKKPKNQISYRTGGVGVGLNACRTSSSAARLYMLGKNAGKASVIWHPTGRKFNAGDEIEYGKTARKVEAESDVEVEAIFFPRNILNTSEPNLWGKVQVVVRNLETGIYDVIELDKFNTQNMDLGFEYKYNDDLVRSIKPGAQYRKGTVFAQSARLSESNEWCPGIETKVAAMSHVYTEEDAVLIFESYARKIGVTFSRKHDYQWNEEEFIPLNLYGTADKPQLCPLSGERVRDDGIVMGFRRKDPNAGISGMTKRSLMIPDPIYDVLFYSSPNCIVADIEVQTERYKNQANNRKAEKLTQPHTLILEKIEEEYNNYYNDIVKWFVNKERQYADEVPLSGKLWNLIFMARGAITRDFSTPHANGKFHKVKRKIHNINLKDWRIIVTLKEDVEGKVRFKNTGMDGNKSVIMKILPDSMAPVDEYGNKADMIVGNTPAFRRQTLGSLIELDVNFVNQYVYKEIKQAFESKDFAGAWEKAHKFYATVNPSFGELCEQMNADERMSHLQWIMKDENEFSVLSPSGTDDVGIKITERLADVYPHIKPTPVTYMNENGEKITTIHPIVISSLYYLMLDKFGDDISCQSMPKLNIFGLPTSLSKHERARDFYRATLNRNVGETEGRLFINQKGGAAAVRSLALANSPELLSLAGKRIIRADNPFLIKHLIKPGEERRNHSLQVIDNIMSDFGIRLRTERPDDVTHD